LYIHIFKIKKSKNIKKYKNKKIKKIIKREAPAGLHIGVMIAFSISHL